MNLVSGFRLTPAAAAICLLAHASAQAQTAGAPAAPSAAASSAAAAPTPAKSGVSELSTVVVTGQRATGFSSAVVGIGAFRDQKPVDVPLTNSVITRDAIDAQGQRTLMGAVRNTAGVTRSQLSGATYDNLAIRGITMENRSSYRLNGSLPLIGIIDIPMENKERVEVLKGASSMYYGMVPPAGIVAFETKRAGPKPVTSFATSINEYGGVEMFVDVGRRFGEEDKFGLRVNAGLANEQNGIDNWSGERNLLSAAFDFRALDNLTFRLDLEHYQKRNTEQAAIALFGAATVLPRVPENTTNLSGEWAKTRGTGDNSLLRMDWGITDNWNITADYGIAHARRDRRFSQFNFDGPASANPASYDTGAGTTVVTVQDGYVATNYNGRLDLSGRVETGPFAHEMTFGYTRNSRVQDNRPGGTQLSAANNLYDPVEFPFPPSQPDTTRLAQTKIVDRGIYAVDRIIFTKWLHVMAGIRHTNYQSEATRPTPGVPYKTSANSPNVSVIFKATPDFSIYASRLKGLEAGSITSNTFVNGNALLPAAVSVQKELGLKWQMPGGMLAQMAYFNIDRAQTLNLPAAPLLPGDPPDPVTVTSPRLIQTLDGKARFRGIEAALSGDISRNFGVIASAMFMDPKIVVGTTTGSGATAPTQGKIPGNAAKKTFSLFGEYRTDAVPGLAFNAGYYYTGKRPVADTNNVFMPGVGTLSLGSRYKTKLGATDATYQINIDNATNKDYWSAADTSAGNPLISYGAPRLIRIAAKFDY